MAAAHAVRECIWLRYLLSDLGYGDLQPTQYSKLCGKDYEKERMLERCSNLEIPVMMCGDNKGCIAISKNPVLHKRSKHIHIAYHLVRQAYNKRQVSMVYINTKDNLADLMTKTLTRVPHQRLTSMLLRRGTVGDLKRFANLETLAWKQNAAVKDSLYKKTPLGLKDEDSILRDEHVKLSTPARAAKSEEESPEIVTGVDIKVKDILTQFAELLVSEFAESSDFWGTAMSASLLDAIVDSGASFTFVTDKVQLSNPMPGKSKVWVANGQSEDIAEMGRLGPLMARKVKSFDRTLISVRDLVDKYGGVYFDEEGVHLITHLGEDLICSTIGAANAQRLYGFNLTGLQDHHDKVSKLVVARQ